MCVATWDKCFARGRVISTRELGRLIAYLPAARHGIDKGDARDPGVLVATVEASIFSIGIGMLIVANMEPPSVPDCGCHCCHCAGGGGGGDGGGDGKPAGVACAEAAAACLPAG